MRQDNPLLLAGVGLAMVAMFVLWIADLRRARAGMPHRAALPGATPARTSAVVIAIVGALGLLGLETWGEIQLGIVGEQSTLTVLAALFTLGAAFGEELVFRGYLVVQHRGRAVLVGSIVGFSLIFALAHPFLWTWNGGLDLAFTPSLKGWFSTGITFAGSLWFYFVRFQPANPGRSLLPCIAAHATKNAGVIAIKASQGYLVGWA